MNYLKRIVPEFIKRPIRSYVHEKQFLRSQAGQDLWVIGEVFDGMRGGFFLDVGAYDGIEFSNSYILEKKYRWRGICIEADAVSFAKLRRNRSAKCINACLDSTEGVRYFYRQEMFGHIASDLQEPSPDNLSELVKVNTTTLEKILIQCGAPSEIDYLSLDIEGSEERVLARFPFDTYRFKCMTIERPTTLLRGYVPSSGVTLICCRSSV